MHLLSALVLGDLQVIGDLLPQAICVRHGLRIGSYIYLLVHLARLVTCPISWPLARCVQHRRRCLQLEKGRVNISLHSTLTESDQHLPICAGFWM